MQLGENLIGKPVISTSDGRQVATVKDFYLDELLQFVAGVHLSKDDISDRDFSLVKRSGVKLFGMDAILIADSNYVINGEQVPEVEEWLRWDRIKGWTVQTPDGARVGLIGDVMFDKKGRIIVFELSQVFVEGPIASVQALSRESVVDMDNADGIMTIDLTKASQQILRAMQNE
jgi:uncharacterized protein YrrD